jgi:hypothetical protein
MVMGAGSGGMKAVYAWRREGVALEIFRAQTDMSPGGNVPSRRISARNNRKTSRSKHR